jgi:hypothetical protein
LPATARRDFIFIDEHGDPGPAATGSTHFASIAVHTTDASLVPLVECFADLRFYRQIYKETKSLDAIPALRPKLAEILRHMAARLWPREMVTRMPWRKSARWDDVLGRRMGRRDSSAARIAYT